MTQINGVPDAYRGPAPMSQAVDTRQSGSISPPRSEKGKPSVIPADRVGVSDISRKMRLAMEEAASLPTESSWVRKVASLGRAVRDGSYIVNPDKIAEKMLASTLAYAMDSPLIS